MTKKDIDAILKRLDEAAVACVRSGDDYQAGVIAGDREAIRHCYYWDGKAQGFREACKLINMRNQ